MATVKERKIPLDDYRYNDYTSTMSSRLQEELKTTKGLESVEQETFLGIQRTADPLGL